MSLRIRLVVLYTALLGLVLVGFGFGAFARVSAVLLSQVDLRLETAVEDTADLLRVSDSGEIGLVWGLSFDRNITIQLWDAQGRMVDSTNPADLNTRGPIPLNQVALALALGQQDRTLIDDYSGVSHYRVLTTPLESIDGTLAGVLQARTGLENVDQLLVDLRYSLLIFGSITMLVAAIIGWLTTKRALNPLSVMTHIASEITMAEDLSRRIPEMGTKGDEVGQLIAAFNQTLGRLEKLFYMQRRFLADVSHELRTPLTVIKGNADLMRRMGKMDEESINSIDQEIDRLTRMVGDILFLAQAEAGKVLLARKLVELDTLVLEVYQQACILAGGTRQIHIEEIDQVLVCVDRDKFKQVLLNLLGNAVKYTPDGEKIIVRVWKEKNQAYFSVEDTGPGIPEEDIDFIFERFYRAEKSRSRRGDRKGFGLGLSIAKWIVDHHGGEIKVVSQLGVGSLFTVSIPLSKGECDETPMAIGPDVQQPERIS